MSRREARALLDAVKGGAIESADQIRRALVMTGDISEDREGDAVRIVRPAGTWERKQENAEIRRADPFDGLIAA